jgi:hypothetical protein
VKVEFISQEWLKCFQELSSVYGLFPSPGERNIELTKEKVEKISKLLNKMRNLKPTKEQIEIVKKINPNAEIIRHWQKHFENDYINQISRLLNKTMDEDLKKIWKEYKRLMGVEEP